MTVGGVLYDVTLTPHMVVDPPPPPPPPPPADRDRVRMLWHHGWDGPSIDSWPVDVASSITAVGLVMCQSAGAGGGRLTDPPGVTKAQSLRLQSAGIDVLAGIGGSDDGGISITTPAAVAQALASIQGMRDRLAITGVILDLEGAPGAGWTPPAMTDLGHALVAAGLKVSIWSALYGGRLDGWGQVARSLGGGLHSWQRGFYDFGEANDARLSDVVTSGSTGLAAMRPYLTTDAQLVASFAPVGSTSKTPVAVMTAAYAAARARWPKAGWSMWEDFQDGRAGWRSIRALATL